jgi:hypothetical protein
VKPSIFVGSSGESVKLADGVIASLKHDGYPALWSGTFHASSMTVDSLLETFKEKDFGVFVFGADDITNSRGVEFHVPRDNVVFEAGLFMGMHGRDRTFVVTPSGGSSKFHMPSDLSGFTSVNYDEAHAKLDKYEAAFSAGTEIKRAIEKSGWAEQKIEVIHKKITWEPTATYKMKLHFAIVNHTREPVLVQSVRFEFDKQQPSVLTNVYGDRGVSKNIHKPEFRIGKESDGMKDHYESQCYLPPERSVSAWVAYEPGPNPVERQAELQALCATSTLGEWTISCVWDGRVPRKYRIAV